MASISLCRGARFSRCSARPGAARRRCCVSCAASSARMAASSKSTGAAWTAPAAFVPTEHRRIGYVPQEGALFPHLSVAENIVFGLPRGERRAHHRVAELLALVGLPLDYRAACAATAFRRAAATRRAGAGARAVARTDPARRTVFFARCSLADRDAQAVARALAQTGTTAVLVTHDQAEALSLGQQVAVLWNGKLDAERDPRRRSIDGRRRANWRHSSATRCCCAASPMAISRAARSAGFRFRVLSKKARSM